MNPKSVFDQLLQSGRSALEEAGRGVGRDDLGKYATGAAVGGVLGLLLGTRRGRRLGGAASILRARESWCACTITRCAT